MYNRNLFTNFYFKEFIGRCAWLALRMLRIQHKLLKPVLKMLTTKYRNFSCAKNWQKCTFGNACSTFARMLKLPYPLIPANARVYAFCVSPLRFFTILGPKPIRAQTGHARGTSANKGQNERLKAPAAT